MTRANRVKQTVTGTGTGDLTLGAAPLGYRTVQEGIGTGTEFEASVEQGGAWEIGTYRATAGGVLERVAVIESSNANAPVDWPAGDKLLSHGATAQTLGSEAVSDLGTVSSGTVTLDVSQAGWFRWVAAGDHTVDLTGWPVGRERRVRALVTGAADHTIAWPAGVRWSGGAPVFSPTVPGVPDVSTAMYSNKSKSVASEQAFIRDVAFITNGTAMYIVGNDGNVHQYTLSTAWDVSTATYASKSISVAAQSTYSEGIAFSNNGTSLYVSDAGASSSVYQYTLSTAWDVSTATYANKSISVAAQSTSPTGVTFSGDGTKMYIAGNGNKSVYQYTLSTAWDVSTATYANKSISVAAQVSALSGAVLSPDGTSLYVVDTGASDSVYQYTLSTAWDVSTATYASKSLSVAAQDTSPTGVTFSGDGTKMYIAGLGNKSVYQYSVTVGISAPRSDIIEFDTPDSGSTVYAGIVWSEAGQ